MINERCVNVSVANNDTLTMGSRSYQLVIDPPSPGSSSVPVLVYPNTIPIIVIDNDGPGKQAIWVFCSKFQLCDHVSMSDASFSISSPQPVLTVQEGDRIDNITVQKSGNTVLSYNVHW